MKKGPLLGASFSYDLGISLASEFTDLFLGMFLKRRQKSLMKYWLKTVYLLKSNPLIRKLYLKGASYS
jgi:hypothetical protein